MINIAEIILPLPVRGSFKYIIPNEYLNMAQIGSRVMVQFGKKKIYTGIIQSITQSSEAPPKLKNILEVVDSEPIVNRYQLDLIDWMSRYYMCEQGEVLRAALPSGLKLNSESRIEIIDKNWEERLELLEDADIRLLEYLEEREQITLAEASNLLEKINPRQVLKKLADHEFIGYFEEVVDRYRIKKIRKIRLTSEFNTSEKLEDLFESLEGRDRQIESLMLYLRETAVLDKPSNNQRGYSNASLIKLGASQSSLNTLSKNGIFEFFEERVSRFPFQESENRQFELSIEQKKAFTNIKKEWEDKDVVLLHGITGSGKTEIYIRLIQECMAEGRQCLYLLPEIALTTHIVERLQKVFGNEIGVYHSKFSDNERVEIWENLQKKKYSLLVGVRSSLFLPFENLGLVIIDEEHDASYKQHEPAPRYHARESAIMLSSLHKAKILLGSATPSLESYFLTENNKWGRVNLDIRYHSEASLPKLEMENFRESKIKGLTKSLFTLNSIAALQKSLDDKNQVIVFQNRRGYSPYLQCQICAYIPSCHQCDVSLVLHQYQHQLRCHYCGFYEEPPKRCPKCNSTHFTTMGTGTEKVEEELGLLFTDASIQRMDLDTTRGKYAHQGILNAFEKKEIDFLVGTQMVTKGLDFNNVELVLVLDVDRLLFFPDFRSIERTFQTITQVSGRSGRKSKKGRVIIQTNKPDHEIFDFIFKNDYLGFYKWELEERQKFNYPPFTRIIKLVMKSRDEYSLEDDAFNLAKILISKLGKKRVLGPEKPPVSRIRNLYIQEIFLKYERDKVSPSGFKQKIKECIEELEKISEAPNLRIIIDVDPV